MSVVTRFAPSPTGFLHIGNARTAVICSLAARAFGGKNILRIDDTDTERSEERFIDAIKRDLEWLGCEWHDYKRQSERTDRYRECIENLKENNRLYPCYETSEELEVKRKIALSRGRPPIYDREALGLTEAEKRKFEAEGRRPHWRFKLDHEAAIIWRDLIRSDISFDPSCLSDPVLIRESGIPTYMLPSAIDDVDFGVTHVVRGEDHISNTAIQLQLFKALGSAPPAFAHLSLLKSAEGKISKRKGGNALQDFRKDGLEAMTVVSYLSRLGTSRPIEPIPTWEAAAEGFDFSLFSRSSCVFDPDELTRINARILHEASYESVAERPDMDGTDKRFWLAIRGNISVLPDIAEWKRICREKLSGVIDDDEFMKEAADLLPPEPWDEKTWKLWIDAVKNKTGRKGKLLFMPLRLALTGRDSGPELAGLLPLIGREKAQKRLSGEAA